MVFDLYLNCRSSIAEGALKLKNTARNFSKKFAPLLESGTLTGRNWRRAPFRLGDSTPSLGRFFSYDIEELDQLSEKFEAMGPMGYAAEASDQATFLRGLLAEDAIELKRFLAQFQHDPQQLLTLRWLAGQNPDAAAAICNKTSEYFSYLKSLAETGNTSALFCLAEIALSATDTLNRIAQKNPEMLKPISKFEHVWPVLKSPDPHFSTREGKLLKKLEIKSKHSTLVSTKRRYIPKNKFGQLSWELWHYVRGAREMARTFLDHYGIQLEDYATGACVAETLEERAALLPEPEPKEKIALDWSEVGRAFLIEAYPNEKSVQININDPAFAGLVTAETHRRNTGAIRNRIYEGINKNFCYFKPFELAHAHGCKRFAFGLINDGRRISWCSKTALHDIESRTHKPLRFLDALR